jgi:hypothetical protein
MYKYVVGIHNFDESLSTIVRDKLILPDYEKMLKLLKPWSENVNPNCNTTNRVNSLHSDQINHILILLSQTERHIGTIYSHRNQFSIAESHLQQAVSYARLYGGTEEKRTFRKGDIYEGTEEKRIETLCRALQMFYELRTRQGIYIYRYT